MHQIEFDAEDLSRRVSNLAPQLWRRLATRFRGRVGAGISGVEASQFLDDLSASIRMDLERGVIHRLSPAGWLWCLRRIPLEVLPGSQLSTPLLILRVAEKLSAESMRRGSSDFQPGAYGGRFVVSVSAGVKDAVARLLAAAIILNFLESTQRRVSKGQVIVWDAESSYLATALDHVLDSRLAEFDERSAGLPTSWFSLIASPGSESINKLMPLLTLNRLPKPAFTRPSLSEGERPTAVSSRFSIAISYLSDRIRNPSIAEVEGVIQHPEFLSALVVLSSSIPHFRGTAMEISLLQVGYLVIHDELLRGALDVQISELLAIGTSALSVDAAVDSEELIGRLAAPFSMRGTTHGTVLRAIGSSWMVDVYAASSWLLSRLTVDKSVGGEAVNVVGFQFEDRLQEVIDEIPAVAPIAGLRQLRGRTLFFATTRITDVDALFHYKTTLVLISCKTPDYTAEYDHGAFREIRNVDVALGRALSNWAERIAQFHAHPVGANYDFSLWDVVGIVVTPRLLFTSSDAGYIRDVGGVPGLRSYMSFDELEQLLRTLT